MAHQAKQGISVKYRPKVLLDRPALASLLGLVSAEWSRLDNEIMVLYAYLMGERYLPRTPGFTPPLHPVAFQIFDTLEPQRLRLDLLKKLAKWIIKDEDLLKELNTNVVSEIRKAAKLRNNLVHANWGVAKEYPDALVRRPTFGRLMVYEEADFNEAIDRILEARDKILKFNVQLRAHLEKNDGA